MKKQDLIKLLAGVKSGSVKIDGVLAQLSATRGLAFTPEAFSLSTILTSDNEKASQSAFQLATNKATEEKLDKKAIAEAGANAIKNVENKIIASMFSTGKAYFVKDGALVSLPLKKTRGDGRTAEFVPYYRTMAKA